MFVIYRVTSSKYVFKSELHPFLVWGIGGREARTRSLISIITRKKKLRSSSERNDTLENDTK